jgi:cytochrome c553
MSRHKAMQAMQTMLILAIGVLTTLSVGEAMAAPKAGRAAKGGSQTVPAAPPPGDPLLGREKAESERCIECHGVDGKGVAGRFPALAGRDPAYILNQIRDFRTGARKDDQMGIVARNIADGDMADIAAYFAGLPAP